MKYTTTLPITDNQDGTIQFQGMRINKDAFRKSIEHYKENSIHEVKLGELSHDSTQMHTSLTKVSHTVERVEQYDDGLGVEMKVLDTPNGKLIQQIINNDYKIEVHPRCYGEVDENGVITSCELLTFDIDVHNK